MWDSIDFASLFREFITIAVVVDPVGTIPVFLAATVGMRAVTRRRIAIRAVLTAGGVLLFFLVLGQIVLETLGLALGTFQIAGGIVLFLFALTMIFGQSKAELELESMEESSRIDRARDKAVFPLAIPSIASPGAMLAVVILTDNHRTSLVEQTVTAGLLMGVLLLTLLLLLAAGPIQRWIGTAGASLVSRVMGIILSTVAVDAVLKGLAVMGLVSLDA
ncbi:MarC family protein [Notoacmeibacter ruber]|uniref:UPF0056 membrane protein n=1 Tax=Notoacmeibacter ruber TaxID=2670375 RepID=A0A3L7JE33_9HYPH|nr:MarC family protein [Notoacmeibacter ruber]RLQ88730.1 MarC family protein [Notoacmeibacter ruber]